MTRSWMIKLVRSILVGLIVLLMSTPSGIWAEGSVCYCTCMEMYHDDTNCFLLCGGPTGCSWLQPPESPKKQSDCDMFYQMCIERLGNDSTGQAICQPKNELCQKRLSKSLLRR